MLLRATAQRKQVLPMRDYRGSGRLDTPARVVEFQRGEDGAWNWVPVRNIWAEVEYSQKNNIFSSSGMGARDVSLVVWQQPISLLHAIEVNGDHLLLTSITKRNRNQLDIHAALVDIVQCEDKLNGMGLFPAVMVEKYVRFEEPTPHSTNTVTCVLVTPKAIKLKPGKPLEVGGVTCPVRTMHPLDPYKNEYEIERKFDL